MTAVPIAKGRSYVLVSGVVNGPSSYATGGFTITVPDITKVVNAVVVLKSGDNLYKAGFSSSGNKITVVVYELSSSTAGLKVEEVAAGTDLSSVEFAYIVIGE